MSHDSRRARRLRPLRAPAWARPSGSFRDHSEADALFFAGAALAALDSVVRSDPSWAGVWRRRLALKSPPRWSKTCSTGARTSPPCGTRSHLAKPGQELGPAGRVYAALRTLCSPSDPFRPERLAAVAADLQAPLDPQMAAELADALREAASRPRALSPARRGRGRRSGDCAARRRRAARDLGSPTPCSLSG